MSSSFIAIEGCSSASVTNYISDDSKDSSLLTTASPCTYVASLFNTGLRFIEILKTVLSLSDLVLKGDFLSLI